MVELLRVMAFQQRLLCISSVPLVFPMKALMNISLEIYSFKLPLAVCRIIINIET